MNKHLLSVAALLSFTGLASHAAIIASTNFDVTTKSAGSQTMTNVVWTGDDLVSVTPGTSITTAASNNAGYFTSGFGATGFAPDQNIENEGPWAASIDLVFNGGASGSLGSIEFDYASLTNAGASQSGFRAQNFDITVNGIAYDVQKQTTTINGNLTFTAAAALNTGSNSIVITSSEVDGPGWNMGIDNLTFNGTVVPEPSSTTILLGLCTLGLLRRRRV